MLATAKTRIDSILSRVECNLVRRLSALAESASSAVCSPRERAASALALLASRRDYLAELTGRKFEMWAAAAQAYAESGESYTSALSDALRSVSESTGRIANQQLYTLVLTILTALRIAGFFARAKSEPLRSNFGSQSAADLFVAAQLFLASPIGASERLAQTIVVRSGVTGCRFLLPLPRSSFPAFDCI
jgi:hypothetical protein